MEREKFDELIDRVLADGEIAVSDIPAIDLYMDQIVTIFEDKLASNKRRPEDKLLTRTMINNYSKERLLKPLAGKKYSREHILQLLLVYQMKQILLLQDIKQTLPAPSEQSEEELAEVYERFLMGKDAIRGSVKELAHMACGESILSGLDEKRARLLTVLELTAAANFLKRIAEEIIDEAAAVEDENQGKSGVYGGGNSDRTVRKKEKPQKKR